MKLIRQTTLWCKEGKSDKIYQVDLCQSGENEYLVNFRFGRRGAHLQEGTKTVFPLPPEQAQTVFDELIRSKIRKGYKNVSPSDMQAESADAPFDDQRAEIILKYLTDAADARKQNRKWPLSRIIWRAGELKIRQAVPLLIRLAEKPDAMQKYCLAWALGRCAVQGDADALEILKGYYANTQSPAPLRRMACAGLCRIQDENAREQFALFLTAGLPEGLGKSVGENNAEILHSDLETYLFELKTTANEFLTELYLLSAMRPHVRAALKEILKTLPLEPGYFKPVRHIFKIAEFREDAEIYALLAYRFETAQHFYRQAAYFRIGNEYVETRKEKKKENPKTAYSDKTRNYLRKRIIRTFRRMGDVHDPLYAETATEFLLLFRDDKNAVSAMYNSEYHYADGRFQLKKVWYDRYAPFLIFNSVLYGQSPRYEYLRGSNGWRCVPPFEPGNAAPEKREEAFPELWEKSPGYLLKLLSHSHCQPVQEFAVKTFRTVPEYETHAEIGHIIAMLALPYAVTAQLALELAKKKYQPDKPDLSLVAALILSSFADARETAKKWMQAKRDFFMADTAFVSEILLGSAPDIRKWLRSMLPMVYFSSEQKNALIGRIITGLLYLAETEDRAERIQEIGEILFLVFPDRMAELGTGVIRDMLRHPVLEMQVLAGQILLRHRIRPEDLPEDLYQALLNADSGPVRGIGVQLLGKLGNESLLRRQSLLASLCLSPFPEVREAVRPIITRLAKDREFGRELVRTLCPVLLFKESCEGIHADVYALFMQSLAEYFSVISEKTVWRLIRSRFRQAQLLGTHLLQNFADKESLSIDRIVELAGHELVELREFSRDFYRKYPDRIRENISGALGILDSDWEDSRQFAFDFFRTHSADADWTPALLCGICDSVRPDVQAFGRELITRFFDEAHGPEYLIKLSQHPSGDLQLFVTNYLEKFASGQPDRIERLEPYFVTLLSQVNRARVAKQRVFRFLHTEAVKNEHTARIAARILERHSLSIAMGEKAACIEILRDIHKAFPEIPSCIAIKQIPEIRPRNQ